VIAKALLMLPARSPLLENKTSPAWGDAPLVVCNQHQRLSCCFTPP